MQDEENYKESGNKDEVFTYGQNGLELRHCTLVPVGRIHRIVCGGIEVHIIPIIEESIPIQPGPPGTPASVASA